MFQTLQKKYNLTDEEIQDMKQIKKEGYIGLNKIKPVNPKQWTSRTPNKLKYITIKEASIK